MKANTFPNTIQIGETTFKVIRPRKRKVTQEEVVHVLGYSHKSIYDVYDRPSHKKVSIFEYWNEFAKDHNLHHLSILAYNTFVFTLGAIYELPEDHNMQYFLYITPSKNEAYPIQ